MRITVYVLGTITLMTLSLGLFFKVLHFSGAYELIILGMLLFILLIPLVAIYQYRKEKI